MKQLWSIVDRGVNGEPFLWKRNGKRKYVMIDIFNPDQANRCYSVMVFPKSPYSDDPVKGETIGVGCARRTEENWTNAYERARKIAERFMKNDIL